jgi:glycosyltransferase involved in cell wall biosynthesis
VTQRVALVVEQLRQPVPGGIGTYCRGLLQGLAQLAAQPGGLGGVDLVLVASRAPGSPDPLAGWPWPLLPSALPRPLLGELWRRGVVGLPAGARSGVVHATSLAAPWRAAQRGAALVVTVHDLAWRQHPEAYPARGRRWHEASLRHALRRAQRIVVPSVAVAEQVEAAGAAAPVAVVPHGADHLPPPDEPATEAWLARAGVEGPFLLTVGTLEPRKNLGRVLAAFARARAELGEDLALVVVGPAGWGRQDGPPDPREPASAGVVFAGSLPGPVLVGLYRRAVALVYAPLAEGFGLPPLEAMAAGTAVVASPVPSVDEEVALVVDPLDVAGLAGAMVAVVTEPARRRRLVAAGRARAATRTWQAVAEAHLALWRELGARTADGRVQ